MALDNEKVLARHSRYNRSAKGKARQHKYRHSVQGKAHRYAEQRSRRLSRRLEEMHGINGLQRHAWRKTYGRCAHCRCKAQSGYKHCKWCREAWDAAEVFWKPSRIAWNLANRRARWNWRRRTSEAYKESRRFYMRSKRRAARIAEGKF
jgi:hypothetical protein